MRERDEIKMVVRHYRFSLIRVRMPDGFILQGTSLHCNYVSPLLLINK